MMKINYNKIFRWLFVILWMMVIFKFSNEPAIVSNKKSSFVIDQINSVGIDINGFLGKTANFIVRKLGHITEYLILCILLINGLKEIKGNKIYFFSIGITFLYACSDEFHQLFIQGRSGRFEDVLIDTLGGVIGIIIYKLYKRKSL